LALFGCEKQSGLVSAEKEILLKNYRPESIYKIPRSKITKAKFPAIDIHSHAYARSLKEIDQWVNTMNKVGIERTVILTKKTGAEFDSLINVYGKYPDKFELWCGFDLSNFDDENSVQNAIKELERCAKAGAKGVGEISDKGKGLNYSDDPNKRIHLDDPRLKSLFDKCAELNLPVNVHVADPIWMYLKMDSTNDGMMNAVEWRLDNAPDIRSHAEMIRTLERVVSNHPKTIFIACHFANLSYDLNTLGILLDRYDNLYADIAARYAETAPIPRFVSEFYNKYQDKIVYGTDMGFDEEMYHVTFRILESSDEHFYEINQFNYHWALNGLALNDKILKKVYRENAVKILNSVK